VELSSCSVSLDGGLDSCRKGDGWVVKISIDGVFSGSDRRIREVIFKAGGLKLLVVRYVCKGTGTVVYAGAVWVSGWYDEVERGDWYDSMMRRKVSVELKFNTYSLTIPFVMCGMALLSCLSCLSCLRGLLWLYPLCFSSSCSRFISSMASSVTVGLMASGTRLLMCLLSVNSKNVDFRSDSLTWL